MTQLTYFDDSSSVAFSVKKISRIELHTGENISYHVHRCAEFICILEGNLTVIIKGQAIHLDSGDSFVVFKGIPHSISVSNDSSCTFYSLNFNPFIPDNHDTFSDIMSDTYLTALGSFSYRYKSYYLFKKNENVYHCIATIFSEFSLKNIYWKKNSDLQMYSLILLFLREIDCSAGDKNVYTNKYLIPAFDYIEANYMHKILITDIATYCNVSPRHLSKLFLSFSNEPISRFINSFRIDKSIELLLKRTDDISLTDIAAEMGFSSLQHFSKIFKEEIGISPKNYKLLLNSNPH